MTTHTVEQFDVSALAPIHHLDGERTALIIRDVGEIRGWVLYMMASAYDAGRVTFTDIARMIDGFAAPDPNKGFEWGIVRVKPPTGRPDTAA